MAVIFDEVTAEVQPPAQERAPADAAAGSYPAPLDPQELRREMERQSRRQARRHAD